MPIYEYQCEDCSHVFETLVLGKETEALACEKCKSRRVVRRISAANTIGGSSKSMNAACTPNPASGFS